MWFPPVFPLISLLSVWVSAKTGPADFGGECTRQVSSSHGRRESPCCGVAEDEREGVVLRVSALNGPWTIVPAASLAADDHLQRNPVAVILESSATRPSRGHDCNQSPMAGVTAAHGQPILLIIKP